MGEFAGMAVGDFIRVAASDAPTPGGGAIAALAGALGGAMASMAANFTVGKPRFAEHETAVRSILDALAPVISDLQQAVDGDAAAFAGISAAYKLPKATDAEKAARAAAVDAALAASMRVPLGVLRNCAVAAALLPELARRGNPNLLSDVEVAGIMLDAAARAALVNVFANSSSLKTDEARNAEAEGEGIVRAVGEWAAEAALTIRDRNGR